MIRVFDDFLPDPLAYREAALTTEFKSFYFPHCVFHGISHLPINNILPIRLADLIPGLKPTLTFFRKSPLGQEEPNFIHTDIDMGEITGILYLNPNPPKDDGTVFWTHSSGAIESRIPHERSEEGRVSGGWKPRQAVSAKFNRLLVFPSAYFHSRALYDNWGDGDSARLTQVVFSQVNQ